MKEMHNRYGNTGMETTSKKPKKAWGKEITSKDMENVIKWCERKINLVELMEATHTNTTSVYSLISRAMRIAFDEGKLNFLVPQS